MKYRYKIVLIKNYNKKMEELNYLRRKQDAIETVKSRICKDLNKLEEIVSDLKNFFEANHDGFWEVRTSYSLEEAMHEFDKWNQSIKSIMG